MSGSRLSTAGDASVARARQFRGWVGDRLASLPHRLQPPSIRRRTRWSIGIYVGRSPLALGPAPAAQNPVLTRRSVSDVDAGFVADPFLVHGNGAWHMFFEVPNRRLHTGQIGLASSTDGFRWSYRQIVLAEPTHLSYPHTFEVDGSYYMVPEMCAAKAVRLYQATSFPTGWRCVAELLTGQSFKDATLFRHADRWWMFTETSADFQNDTLRLYHADDLLGPWREHAGSPVVSGDARIARPAGRVVVDRGRIVRFAQDCMPVYGRSVSAFEVVRLTPTEYAERPLLERPLLAGTGTGWNRSGMHHVDVQRLDDGRWIACVDGW